MAEYLFPGVYVEEFDHRSRTMAGVSTSTAGFVGLAERGPVGGSPVLVTRCADFTRMFGGPLAETQFGDYRFLAHSVEIFFQNGGSRCYIARVVPKNAQTASCIMQRGDLQMKLTASNPGAWGNTVSVSFTPSATDKFNVRIAYADMVEIYSEVTFDADDADYIVNKLEKSALINIEVKVDGGRVAPALLLAGEKVGDTCEVTLSSGSDGSANAVDGSVFLGTDQGVGKRTGLQAFRDNEEVSIMAIPGITDPHVQLSLVSHCENLGNRFAILDLPKRKNSVADLQVHRETIDSSYAAVYHPWLQVYDPGVKKYTFIPPSGAVAGIYARTDQVRGVHKAPANEVIKACTGLEYQYNTSEQNILTPQGVNLIRLFVGEGIKIWGSRTCSSDRLWRYINVRRLFIFLEESIKRNTAWVAFEPNDHNLWAWVKNMIEDFLTQMWRNGALMGASPQEAFFVKVDMSTMTQDDIANNRLICLIGAAPVRPAEFITFWVTQKTAERE